ncbi:MAG: hypothetical protein RLZZ262_1366 [Bacteroidota bacterium]
MVMLISWPCWAQKTKKKTTSTVLATSASERKSSALQHSQLADSSPLRDIPAVNIGPTVMSGRVVDLAVDPKNSTHFYVAYATGGLWETTNNGASFTPIFDHQEVIGIGALAVDWKNETIWLGTGESNSSRSSYSGMGMYLGKKSGQSYQWKHIGLEESHHIGRIVLHPTDGNRAYVAVIGHLYTPNKERGIYSTSDGGQSWQHVLAIDPHTGCIDVEINPENPSELFASAWTRKRRAWNFEEAGSGSGMYQSTDAGATWQKMPIKGWPEAITTGRIGIAFASQKGKKFLYAFVDNQATLPSPEKQRQGLQKEDFVNMTADSFQLLNNDSLNKFLDQNGMLEEYDANRLKKEIAANKYTPRAIYDFLFEPTAAFYEKEIAGAEVYSYDFTQQTWNKTHKEPLDDVVYSYGYYFGMIEVNPSDPNQVYIAGVPIITSNDGGSTWRGINPVNVHADHHALWIDPNVSGHLINGCDGGIQISYDNGTTWVNCNSPSVAQCYAVTVEQTDDFQVYCGLQDNGVWVGPSDYSYTPEWYQTGQYPYRQIMGGDGMQIAVDPRDNNRILTGYQFGQYALVDQKGHSSTYIHPTHELGQNPLRWNWQTPVLISSHQPDIIYMASNRVHRSTDGGQTFTSLSEDLTRNRIQGDVSFGTITCISESPINMGHIAVGSDDGLVHISLDNGYTWKNITGTVGQWLNEEGVGLWVSRIIFSRHSPARIYVCLNGYRDDFFKPLAYVSEDWGQTWKLISSGIPSAEPINVIKEDPTLENLVYVGTDHGLYAIQPSTGQTTSLSAALPGAAVHDLAIHEKSSTLVIGTHGRGMYKMDLNLVRHGLMVHQLPTLGPIASVSHGGRGNYWSKWFPSDHQGLMVPIYMPMASREMTLHICTTDSVTIATLPTAAVASGLHFFPSYDLSFTESQKEHWLKTSHSEETKSIPTEPAKDGKYYLPRGRYLAMIRIDGTAYYQPFEITR